MSLLLLAGHRLQSGCCGWAANLCMSWPDAQCIACPLLPGVSMHICS